MVCSSVCLFVCLCGRLFENPLRDVEEDHFVLHFYDLSARQPHTLYTFARRTEETAGETV